MSQDELILVAKVAGAFGVKGEVRLAAYTADPMALLGYRDLKRQDGASGLTLATARPHKGGLVVRAQEVTTREEAEALRGLGLYVARDMLPEPQDEDEFYLIDLIGAAVATAEGEALGVVRNVQNFGAGDLLEIAPSEGASWWLPFTREAVPKVDLAGRRIVVMRPEETE